MSGGSLESPWTRQLWLRKEANHQMTPPMGLVASCRFPVRIAEEDSKWH